MVDQNCVVLQRNKEVSAVIEAALETSNWIHWNNCVL